MSVAESPPTPPEGSVYETLDELFAKDESGVLMEHLAAFTAAGIEPGQLSGLERADIADILPKALLGERLRVLAAAKGLAGRSVALYPDTDDHLWVRSVFDSSWHSGPVQRLTGWQDSVTVVCALFMTLCIQAICTPPPSCKAGGAAAVFPAGTCTWLIEAELMVWMIACGLLIVTTYISTLTGMTLPSLPTRRVHEFLGKHWKVVTRTDDLMLMGMQLILVALILRMWIISAALWSAILITVLLAPFVGVFNLVMFRWCIELVTAVLPMKHVKKWSTAWWNIIMLEPPGWSKPTSLPTENNAKEMVGDARYFGL